jgi:hypothetical protein
MPAGGRQSRTVTRARRDSHAGRSMTGQPSRGWARASVSRGWARATAWWRRLNVRIRWLTAVAAVMAVGGLVAGLVVAFTGSPPVGERQYLSFTGCLLTDSAGINGEPAAAAWAGLQDAAAATRMQAQYLAVPAGASGAAPYLASLVTQHCGLIVAVGPAQAAAVASYATRFKTLRFVVVGGAASGANVTIVRGSASAVRSQVDGLARMALAAAG